MRIAAHLPLLLVLAAACAKSDMVEDEEPVAAPDRFAVGATDKCASPGTDSARAVCVALRAARREGGVEPRVVEVLRQADVYCVRTEPADAATTVNGGTTVRVDTTGRVRALLLTDSAKSCADLPPLGGAAARERE
jgi:hypothetical protein